MQEEKVILGKNAVYSNDCSKTGINNNIIVCGSSGCGKTMSISEPRLLETTESSLVITVTKRRLVNKYMALFRERGYEVFDINFTHPRESSCAYDPIKCVKRYTDIPFLAAAIVNANPKKKNFNTDIYWDSSAESLLSAEIGYVLKMYRKPSFSDVLDLHSKLRISPDGDGITTSLDDCFAKLEKLDPTNFAISCWKTFCQLPYRTAGCVYSSLNTVIDTIFTPDLKKMIAMEQKINFSQLGRRKTIMFVSTSPVNPALHSFVNIFYSQLFKELFEYAEEQPDGRLPIPTHVLCDDFGTGGQVQNFPEYISIFREKQISVTLLLQSETQLISTYGETDAVTILNNADSYIYLGGMDLRTSQNISQRLNVPLEDVLYMPVGNEIIFRRGEKPIVTQRYDILNNPLYRKITEEYDQDLQNRQRQIWGGGDQKEA